MRADRIYCVVSALFVIGTANAAQPAGVDDCVQVEVNGQRSPSYSCLTEKLQSGVPTTDGKHDNVLPSQAIINRPSNQLGLFNHAATSHRMGQNFGHSVYPQRPPAASFPSPLPQIQIPAR